MDYLTSLKFPVTWDEVLTTLNYEGERNFRVRKAGRKRKSDA